jgi:hypothetical protein
LNLVERFKRPIPSDWFGLARAFLLILVIETFIGSMGGIGILIMGKTRMALVTLAIGIVSGAFAAALGLAVLITYRSRQSG